MSAEQAVLQCVEQVSVVRVVFRRRIRCAFGRKKAVDRASSCLGGAARLDLIEVTPGI